MENISQYLSQYLFYCAHQKGLDPKTIKAYRIDLTQFSTFWSGTDQRLTKENINAYIVDLNAHFKPKSVKRKIASIKAFITYLEDEELINDNPFLRIKIKLRKPTTLPRTIPFAAIEAVLKSAYDCYNSQDTTVYQHYYALLDIAVLELLFATGIRVSELCSLAPDDVNLEEGTVSIYGKGAKERIVQISNVQVIEALSAYYLKAQNQIEATGWFFINRRGKKLSDQSVRAIICKHTKNAGITIHITPHMFRHSFATLLLEEDVDIRYIQQLLGHSSIQTTQIYTHVTSKKQRDILAAKHPRNKMSI